MTPVADGDAGGLPDDGPDISLSRSDRDEFLTVIATVFPPGGAAAIVLDEIGFPRVRIPAREGSNSEQWWGQIFSEFDAGIIEAPYRRLLRVAIRRYPGNDVFRRLVASYLAAKATWDARDPPSGTSSGSHAESPRQLADGIARGARITTTSGPSKIFLCHASQDKPRVRDLYKRLHDDGLDAWLDAEDLLPGQEWDLEIRRAIRASRSVLVCLSSASTDKRGYVQKEIKYALDVADEQPEGAIYLIPVRLEPCEIPDRLRKWHWVNLFEADGYAKLLRALRATS
ncbi:toll/interleukin-1 receptor domain-containing protein [Frankia sp. CiP1_Cm_nod2]|uniref:toll/interleukin-1 receptor domain-containing protein n=1 Tax=Frankia sp. CiP1_Cm_nod2 TaxID=2897161 RepID=UPI0020252D26